MKWSYTRGEIQASHMCLSKQVIKVREAAEILFSPYIFWLLSVVGYRQQMAASSTEPHTFELLVQNHFLQVSKEMTKELDFVATITRAQTHIHICIYIYTHTHTPIHTFIERECSLCDTLGNYLKHAKNSVSTSLFGNRHLSC